MALNELVLKARRFWVGSQARSAIDDLTGGVRYKLKRGPRPVRVLLVSDFGAFTSDQQFAPIMRNLGTLRDRLGLTIQVRPLESALGLTAGDLGAFDAIGLKWSFRTPDSEAARLASHFRSLTAGLGTRLVYFDGDDDPNVQWPAVIDNVDLYVKKHIFADASAYRRSYVGKSNLTDWIAANYGLDLDKHLVKASAALSEPAIARIHLGWNIGLDDAIEATRGKIASLGPVTRSFDIVSRAPANEASWIYPMRAAAAAAMARLPETWKISAPMARVPQAEYMRELLGSKICVSPFGFGEICWRDFEAILCGCLLVKPDMGHLKTKPDVFEPGVTYVPTKWDFSDLQSACAPYLQDEALRRKVAAEARRRLDDALTADWIVEGMRDILEGLGLDVAGARPASR